LQLSDPQTVAITTVEGIFAKINRKEIWARYIMIPLHFKQIATALANTYVEPVFSQHQ